MTPAQLVALADIEFGKPKQQASEGTLADAMAFGSGIMSGGG
jgi:hypothetical protein